jgi:hypothetical protein
MFCAANSAVRVAVPRLHDVQSRLGKDAWSAQEPSMNRKRITKQEPKIRLALKKETLKDLSPKQNVSGGFIMKDTIIIRTGGR